MPVTSMRASRAAVVVMALWCCLLSVTVFPVAQLTWGAAWVSVAAFAAAAGTNAALIVVPDSQAVRLVSVGCTALAFSWRAVCVGMTWITGGMSHPYGPILYAGIALMIVVRWPTAIPSKTRVIEALRAAQADGGGGVG